MKNLVLLGSTGSIGRQTLDIVARLPGKFPVAGLAANSSAKLLAEQANVHGVPNVCIGSESEHAEELRGWLDGGNKQVFLGVEGMCALATLPEVDLVVVAVAGAIGIKPTHAAL